MKSSLQYILILLILGATGAQSGALSSFTFETPEQEQAFRSLTEEMRCLVCQNESLAGSNADLAQDLRREIYEMMQKGKSKDDIVDFMVARYGDFVLYSPPVKPSTYPLWFGPIVLFALAGFILYRALIRKKASRESELTPDDQERLDKILSRSSDHLDNTK